MRRALGALGNDAAPLDLQAYLKKEFGIKMETSLISNYKSALKGSGKSAVMRKPMARPAARAANTGGLSLDDVRAVKELADRIGAEKVKELAEVLGE